jgi:hypothetical protein
MILGLLTQAKHPSRQAEMNDLLLIIPTAIAVIAMFILIVRDN